MGPQLDPATDFNDAQDEVNLLIRQPQIDAFALRRVVKRVEALVASDPCGRFELLSALAARQDDLDESDTLFRKALHFPKNRNETIARHLQFMQVTLHPRRVLDLFREFYPALRNDPSALRGAHESLMMSGYFATAEELFPDSERMGMNLNSQSESAKALMEGAGVREDEVVEALAHCMAFLRARGAHPDAQLAHFIPAIDGPAGILVEFHVQGDPESRALLEWDMMENVADRDFAAIASGFLSVGVTAARELACP